MPQAKADETRESGDATASGDFSTDEAQQAATEWQTLASQLGTAWAEEQAGEASVEASQPGSSGASWRNAEYNRSTLDCRFAPSGIFPSCPRLPLVSC